MGKKLTNQEIIERIKADACYFKKLSAERKADKEIVMVAVRQNGDALYYASEELRGDKEVVLEAEKKNSDAF